MPRSRRPQPAILITATAAVAVAVSGCGGAEVEQAASTEVGPIVIGTAAPVTALDPAASSDAGSRLLQAQVFPYLLGSAPGSSEVVPDLAESAEFTAPTQYTVTLPAGLTWANGHDLTSSDVKFSFDRQLRIADEEGPSAMLANITWLDTPDDRTIVFNLRTENDRTFPQVLAGAAGAIVDEEVFSAHGATTDAAIVGGSAFGGPYAIQTYTFNELVDLVPNPSYSGLIDTAQNDGVRIDFFDASSELSSAIRDGDVDVAYGGLSAGDVEELGAEDGLTVHEAPVAAAHGTPDMPEVPAIEGTQVAVAAAGVEGVQLDASSTLRMSLLTR
ncbi:ABC transporter substrate-binding protein [Microbacterium halophytorum]|uniref:ABC transporter substrate-binding protein n=1 Tax=Microbacterium halophytorum TaxID=2067568 RepID=UPI000CFA975A|nr:ABC transporter substrate-binding protein [Microbacterium halophytorum]